MHSYRSDHAHCLCVPHGYITIIKSFYVHYIIQAASLYFSSLVVFERSSTSFHTLHHIHCEPRSESIPLTPVTPTSPSTFSLSDDITIIGGNHTGIFVQSVKPGSPAEMCGLKEGSELLEVKKQTTCTQT